MGDITAVDGGGGVWECYYEGEFIGSIEDDEGMWGRVELWIGLGYTFVEGEV